MRTRLLTVVAVALALLLAAWGTRLWGLYRNVDSYAAHWSSPQGQAGGLVYVALGDSAAQGIGASRPERGYVGLLAERIRLRTGRPVLVVNLSVSGALADDVVRTQLPALRRLDLRPDLVTLDVGGNDVRSHGRALTAADLTRLLAALPDGTVVGDIPSFMHGRWERNSADAATLVQRLAAARHLRVARLHDAMRARGWRSMLTDYGPDGFHPNDRGHRIWADAFEAVLPADLLAPIEDQR